MYYIVQENTFKEENYNKLILALERFELPYEIVKVLPFIEEVEFNTKEENVFVFGSLKLARVAQQYNWYPGSLMSETHDFEIYKHFYKENLLNYDSIVCDFADEILWDDELKFIRPCKDTKVFTGKVFNQQEWKDFVVYSLTNGHTTTLDKNTKIQVSTPKNIQQEIRCWVVNGKIITASQYRLSNRVFYKEYFDEQGLEFAQNMINKFQLAPAFVMDICLSNDEWKIVECGCINCAGFYDCDMQKIIMALEENFSE